jgi:hypothetical protein
MPKPFLVERAEALSLLFLLGGGFILAVSLASLTESVIAMGGWAYYTLIIGGILLIIGILWFLKIVAGVRKLHRYLHEPSKAAFQKTLDDVEYLAWTLPSRYENELVEKKKGFGLK